MRWNYVFTLVSMGKINFFTVDTRYKLNHKKLIKNWILDIFKSEQLLKIDNLNVIICSDDYLHEINQKYLQHDFLTDIITFKYSDIDNFLEGELYISIDRVKENSRNLGIPVRNELFRVIAHGILHLCGHNDKRKQEKQKMRELENRYLQILKI